MEKLQKLQQSLDTETHLTSVLVFTNRGSAVDIQLMQICDFTTHNHINVKVWPWEPMLCVMAVSVSGRPREPSTAWLHPLMSACLVFPMPDLHSEGLLC